MKKFLCQALFASFLVFVVYGVAKAQPHLELPGVSVNVDDSVNANLTFENNDLVTTAQLDILFDSNIVSIDPATDIVRSGALLGAGFTLQSAAVAGGVRLTIFNTDPSVLIPDGEIVLMLWEGERVGMAPLSFSDIILGDSAGMGVPVSSTTDGLITVREDILPVNVSIVKTADTSRINPGDLSTVTYTIALESDGLAAATGVTVTDELPEGSEFFPELSSGNCDLLVGANTVQCIVGNLTVGEVSVLQISVTIACEVDVLNQAIVEFLDSQGQTDQNDSNILTVRCSRSSGGGGCSIATGPVDGKGGALTSVAMLLIPALVIGIRRLRRKIS